MRPCAVAFDNSVFEMFLDFFFSRFKMLVDKSRCSMDDGLCEVDHLNPCRMAYRVVLSLYLVIRQLSSAKQQCEIFASQQVFKEYGRML